MGRGSAEQSNRPSCPSGNFRHKQGEEARLYCVVAANAPEYLRGPALPPPPCQHQTSHYSLGALFFIRIVD